MTARLTQQQAADLTDVTARRLRQMDHEGDPPPRFSDGNGYPAGAFGGWLNRRAIAKNREFARGWDMGHEGGRATMAWRVIGEMQALSGPEDAAVADLWPESRQAPMAALRARLLALPNADEVAQLLADYAGGLMDADW